MGAKVVRFSHSVDVDVSAKIVWREGYRRYTGPDGVDDEDPREVEDVTGCTPRDQLLLDAIRAADELPPEPNERRRDEMMELETRAIETMDNDVEEAVDLTGMAFALDVFDHVYAKVRGHFTNSDTEQRLRDKYLTQIVEGPNNLLADVRRQIDNDVRRDNVGMHTIETVWATIRARMEAVREELAKRVADTDGPTITFPNEAPVCEGCGKTEGLRRRTLVWRPGLLVHPEQGRAPKPSKHWVCPALACLNKVEEKLGRPTAGARE